MEKTYQPEAVEHLISEQWLNSNAFTPNTTDEDSEPYCIVIPPPNVTGTLHMGHAFSYTLQDILTRFHRMQGRKVLWQPGTDHAGIATQMVVERLLDKEGLHRRDMGREAFLERVWQWKEHSGSSIISQLKRLGASCDWSRERFTLDEGLSEAVREVFVHLHEEGLIYRGKRLVNWDPILETAVSDLEVQHEEEQGHLWHIRYPLADDSTQSLIVATTRPETLLGDAAVAVHPDDKRYKQWVGKQLILPLTNRTIPVIADTYVDPEFGSGCVKITPAHDFNDYDVGKRHDLPMINLLDTRAHLLNDDIIPEPYRGMECFEARENIVSDLEAEGLLYKIETHTHQVGHGDRSHAVLQPYLTDQWYVAIESLAKPACTAVEDGSTRFVPQHWEKTYFEWMRNIKDWCISRQLWWGHRIPAWYCDDCSHITVARTDPDACASCGGKHIRQDEDVLDTWFSSALWPFSTLGWPQEQDDPQSFMKQFYPTSVLVTGFDIIFFWVARMMMMGIKFMDAVPFKDVYIHALIRDSQGQKMSKSKGNVIDPLAMIDRYGADALRFTLAVMATQGRDVKLDEDRIEASRNFMNKIWNAARFVFMNREDAAPALGDADQTFQPKSEVNRWILHSLQEVRTEIEQNIQEYRFNEAASCLYNFVWGSYCDWYVEAAKVDLYGENEDAATETRITMLTALDGWLRLLHPFCPFLSEHLWHILYPNDTHDSNSEQQALVSSKWQVFSLEDAQAAKNIEHVQQIVTAIRSVRGEMNINPGQRFVACIACLPTVREQLQKQSALLCALAKLTHIEWLDAKERMPDSAIAPLDDVTIFIPLKGVVDTEAELARLDKAIAKNEKQALGLESRLNNPRFCANAPQNVVDKVRSELDELQRKHESLEKAKLVFAFS
ncbi:MAG: valine--tRNA ligase [Mariprofundales bacterium]